MKRQAKVFSAAGFVLVFVPLLMIKVEPLMKSDDRVWQAYLEAEAPILLSGSGTAEAEKFAAD